MNLNKSELIAEVRKNYKDPEGLELFQLPETLRSNVNEAKRLITNFSNKATIPNTIETFYTLREHHTMNGDIALAGSCVINGKNIIVCSPQVVSGKIDLSTIRALFIHELIHLTSDGGTFLDTDVNEALTEISSFIIQKSFLDSNDLPVCFPNYRKQVYEVLPILKKSKIAPNVVVTEFLNKNTNCAFFKENFPDLYPLTIESMLGKFLGIN